MKRKIRFYRLAVVAALAAVMVMLCAGCKAKTPSYLVVEGTTVTGYTENIPANLVIPKGITKIAEDAFRECKSFESVVISTSVKEIGNGAFYECGSFRVEYEGTLVQWCEMDNDSSLGRNAKSIKLKDRPDLKAVTTLDFTGAKRIGAYAFSGCKSLESVVIPVSVKEIVNSTFYECKSLASVEYKGTLAQWCEMDNDPALGENAKSIKLKDGTDLKVTTALDLTGAKRIGVCAFSGCKSLTSVVIPASVKEIGWGAFNECKSLEGIVIPNGVKKIGGWAFRECNSLESVVIPTSVKEIGESDWRSVFWGCGSIKVEYEGTLVQWCEMNNDSLLGRNAKSIRLKDGTDLKLVTTLDLTGAKRIGDGAFSGCKSLESVVIPASAKEIGSDAFGECKSLASVEYGGTLVQWCEMDNDINLGENAKSIKLKDGTDLKLVTTLDLAGAKRIGSGAFSGCKSLESVTIPASVKEIGGTAFHDCKSLKDVYYAGTETEWKKINIIYGNNSLARITIHYGSTGPSK